jgi:cytidine deaminase
MISDPITPVAPVAPMTAVEVQLLDIAQKLLARVWVHGRHEVATALVAGDGAIYTGVHLEGSCRRSSICAEGAALAAARAGIAPELPLQVSSIISVQIKPAGQFRIIAPCGVCRELISDYCPDARVWITGDAGIEVYAALSLLPEKTRRAW